MTPFPFQAGGLGLVGYQGEDPTAASIRGKATCWWEMTEASGTRFDSIGSSHLAVVGSVGTATGVRGDVAADFAGAGGLITSSAAANIVPAGGVNHCLFGWFWMPSYAGTQFLGFKGAIGASGSVEYNAQAFSGGIYGQNGGSSYISAGPISPTTSAWHFVVMWRDNADGKVRVQVDDGAVSASAGTSNPSNTGNQLAFGQPGVTTSNRMTGRLQRWGYTNTGILTPTERTYLYNAGTGRTWAELLAA